MTHAPVVDPSAPNTTSATDDVNEASLFFGISSERLRRRARWAAGFLLLSALLPHELVDTSPLFLWDTLPELSPAAALAALALPLSGLAILIASFVGRRATSLAVVVVSSFALVAVFYQLGGDRAAWDVFSMPESISNRPAAALLALALTAAGASLTFRAATRKLGRNLLAGAIASALFFYAWPSRGEAPMSTLYRAFASLPDLPSFRFQIGMILLAFIVLWPLVIALLGIVFIRSPAQRENPWLTMLATFGLPSLLVMFAYRALIFAQAGLALLAYVFTILVISALLALLSSALVVIGEASTLNEGEIENATEAVASREPMSSGKKNKRPKRNGLPLRASAMVGGALFALLSVTEWVLARPPKKGVEWELSGATDQADEVFGPLFTKWDRARRAWDSEVRNDASATARLEAKQSARALDEASRAVDPKLSEAFVALTSEALDLDLSGRRFFRLVEELNEASQKARLPYYVDPEMTIEETKDGARRHFYASTFRIDSVNRWDVDGRAFATLIVRPLSGGPRSHGLLGFSRDIQPFALVDMDEMEPYRSDLETSAGLGVCTTLVLPTSEAEPAFAGCGEVLTEVVAEAGTGLRDALLVGTERHELQHQIDGPHLTLSGPVLKRLGAYVPTFQDRVNREVSAFTAALTVEGVAPKLELVQLAQFVIGDQHGVYHHTAVIVFEALSDTELRHGTEPDGKVDFRAFRDVLKKLAALPEGELRVRARKAYKSLFNTELQEPKRAP